MNIDNNYTVEVKRQTLPIDKLITDFYRLDKIRPFCLECPMYQKKWSCPPFDFNEEKYLRNYGYADILLLKINYSDTLRNLPVEDQKKIGTLIIKKEKLKFLKKLYDLEKEVPNSKILSAGTCDLCEGMPCARVLSKPCRHPDLMRHSLESLGIDVVKLLDDVFKEDIKWSSDGSLPENHQIVFGFLS